MRLYRLSLNHISAQDLGFAMKQSTGYVKYTAVLALVASFVALAVWITDMYRSSTANYLLIADKCLSQAADTELNIRRTSGMLSHKSGFDAYDKEDTSAYITKTLQFDGVMRSFS